MGASRARLDVSGAPLHHLGSIVFCIHFCVALAPCASFCTVLLLADAPIVQLRLLSVGVGASGACIACCIDVARTVCYSVSRALLLLYARCMLTFKRPCSMLFLN